MTILCDREIRELCTGSEPMISPFVSSQVSSKEVDGKTQKVISYGLSSYGYDIRADTRWSIFSGFNCEVIDPKKSSKESFYEVESSESILLPPHSYALTSSYEKLMMPKDVSGICLGKSTYARCGLIVNVTPLEAGWQGIITIEVANTTPLPLRVYIMEGIMQVLFFRGAPPDVSYANRGGKYMHQQGITYAR